MIGEIGEMIGWKFLDSWIGRKLQEKCDSEELRMLSSMTETERMKYLKGKYGITEEMLKKSPREIFFELSEKFFRSMGMQ